MNSPGKCVECFKILPENEVICDECQELLSNPPWSQDETE